MAKEDLNFNVKEMNAVFTKNNGLTMTFNATNGSKMKVMPVKMGGFSEADGQIRKFRTHFTVDGLSNSADSETVIPFGVEPKINRDFQFAGNHGSVITDIDLKGGMAVKDISVDNVIIEGKVRRVGIVEFPERGGAIPDIRWYEAAGESEFYSSPEPFLVCLIELEDGFIWEVGTGNDLWRWNLGPKHNAGSSFRVAKEKYGIRIERQVYIKTGEDTIEPKRGLRFKWYFAWTEHLPEFTGKKTTAAAFGSLPETEGGLWFDAASDFPESASVMVDAESVMACPCFESNVFRRRFNDWMRSATARYPNRELVLTGVEPHVCLSASHMERPKKGTMLHWDIMSLLDQWLWANRQLRKNGASIRFTGAGKIAEMPSLRGMMQPAYQVENEE